MICLLMTWTYIHTAIRSEINIDVFIIVVANPHTYINAYTCMFAQQTCVIRPIHYEDFRKHMYFRLLQSNVALYVEVRRLSVTAY